MGVKENGRVAPSVELARPGENCLLGEEQREHAETFGEGHTENGLNEDLAGRAGITTDSFSGFGADHTDADGGAEETECAGDITGDPGGLDLSEDFHGGGG